MKPNSEGSARLRLPALLGNRAGGWFSTNKDARKRGTQDAFMLRIAGNMVKPIA